MSAPSDDFVNNMTDELDKFFAGAAPEAEEETPTPEPDTPEAKPEEPDPLAMLDEEPEEDAKPEPEEEPEEEDFPEDLAKQRAAFAKLRRENKELKGKVGKPGAGDFDLDNPETLPEKVRSEIEALRKKAFAFDVRSSKEFAKEVVVPQQQAMDQIHSLMKDYDIDQDVLKEAFAKRSRKEYSDALADIAGDMNQRDQMSFHREIDRLEAASQRRIELEEKAEQASQELGRMAQERDMNRNQQFKDQASREVLPMLDKIVEKRPELADAVAAVRDTIPSSIDGLANPKLAAFASVTAALFPDLLKRVQSQSAEIKRLQESIDGLSSSTPGGRPSEGNPRGAAPNLKIDINEDVHDIAARLEAFTAGR